MLDVIHARAGESAPFAEAFSPESPFESGMLLHGFGASGEDLASLAPLFPVREQWLFPHAPAQIEFNGMLYGKAWFPRRREQLQDALTGAYFRELRAQDPPGLSDAATELLELAEAFRLDWGKTLLGGFSQGAMVAVEVALRAPEPPKGVVLFSGALIAEERWQKGAQAIQDTGKCPARFMQSHGQGDQILPYGEGRALFELLETAGWEGAFVSFRGGHEIPPDVVREAYTALYAE